jgi:hypothetical protein
MKIFVILVLRHLHVCMWAWRECTLYIANGLWRNVMNSLPWQLAGFFAALLWAVPGRETDVT